MAVKGCIALTNVITVHLLILAVCIIAWFPFGNITTLVQAYSLPYATMVWFLICCMFMLINLITLMMDACRCFPCGSIRSFLSHYGCVFVSYGKNEKEVTVGNYSQRDIELMLENSNHGRHRENRYNEDVHKVEKTATTAYSFYFRYLLVVLFLSAEGVLLLYPFFPLSDLESVLNENIILQIFGSGPETPNAKSNIEVKTDAFDFIDYLYPGPIQPTGKYDNARDVGLYGETYMYKTDGTICVPECALDVIQIEDGETAKPVIFHVHGGEWSTGDKSQPNTAIGYWLDRGYAFVSVQYRFPRVSFGSTINDMLDDVEDAWTYITNNADQLNLDSSNIIFMGEDAGGHLATVVAYRVQDAGIRGVINMYGATEWQHYVLNTPDLKLKTEYFDKLIPSDISESESQLLFQEVSSSTYVNQNSPPTLTIQGDSDSLFPISMNEYLHEILAVNNVNNVLLKIPFGEHEVDKGWYSIGGQMTSFAMEQFFISRFK